MSCSVGDRWLSILVLTMFELSEILLDVMLEGEAGSVSGMCISMVNFGRPQ